VRRGPRTLLEARFTPHEPVDYYHRLLTLSGDVVVKTNANYPNTPPDVPRFTTLVGEVWKGGPGPYPPITTPDPDGTGIPAMPAVSSYLGQYLLGAQPANDPGHSENWTLNASGAPYRFFTTLNGTRPYSIESTQHPSVNVSGLAIWLLPRGIRADDKLVVTGSVGAALMIVAGKTTDTGIDNQDRGFNLLGGMESSIPVILVTDGIVGIEHKNNTVHGLATMPMVSIYARDAVFMGPDIGTQTLAHPPGGQLIDQVIDQLYNFGVLPNVSNGVLSRLEREPGTWRDITESDPN
jgi:hypothetical protein